MFTGIIETIGTIKQIVPKGNYLTMTVEHGLNSDALRVGDSIACDGACLTIVTLGAHEFTFEISQETIEHTIAAGYRVGSLINLERAVRVGDRLDGHFVTGHIDTVATIAEKSQIGQSVYLLFRFNAKYDNLVVAKGSIAINGVSLTVNETSVGECGVNLIPYTTAHTNLEHFRLNDKVNIEFDLIGKYALKNTAIKTSDNLTFSKLTESGW